MRGPRPPNCKISSWVSQPRGTWPKSTIWPSHHMMLVAPRSTALTRKLFYSFPLGKIPANYHKKSQITSPQPIFIGGLVNTPSFARFYYAGAAGKKTPLKLEKWLSLLVDFGRVLLGFPGCDSGAQVWNYISGETAWKKVVVNEIYFMEWAETTLKLRLQLRYSYSCRIVRRSAAEFFFCSRGHESWSGNFKSMQSLDLLGLVVGGQFHCQGRVSQRLCSCTQLTTEHGVNLNKPRILYCPFT